MMWRKLKNLPNDLFVQWPLEIDGYQPPNVKQPFLPIRWFLGGLAILVFTAFLLGYSSEFVAGAPLPSLPIVEVVVVLGLAGLAWFFLSELTLHARPHRLQLIWVLALGLALRVMMFPSEPILEVDFNRYQWDGAVTASGLNPYQYSPHELMADSADIPVLPKRYHELSEQSDGILAKINHGHLRTIYPPVTQAAFAIAHFIEPFSLTAWRLVLLLVDIANLVLILLLLRHFGLSPMWVAVYWLNPLLVKEVFNSGHMDVLLFPFLLAAIFYSVHERPYRCATALALAAAVKVWPIILAPLFLRFTWKEPRRLIGAGLWLAGLVGACFLPILLTGLGDQSGFSAYSQKWQLNDSAFRLILWTSEWVLPFFDIHPGHGQVWARRISTAIILIVSAYFTLRPQRAERSIIESALFIVATIFLFSPTQFPWYSLWMLPFLVFVPRRSLLLFSVLLPIYYLRYYFEGRGDVAFFDNVLVWLQFLPVWWVIFLEWRYVRRFNHLVTEGVSAYHEK